MQAWAANEALPYADTTFVIEAPRRTNAVLDLRWLC